MQFENGWTGRARHVEYRSGGGFPFAVEGKPVMAAFAIDDPSDDKCVVIVNEYGTHADPSGREHEESVDAWTVLIFYPQTRNVRVVEVDAWTRAVNRAMEAAYMNEG